MIKANKNKNYELHGDWKMHMDLDRNYDDGSLNALCYVAKESIMKRFFTLIELIVCVSIIMILMSVLVPALSKAKRTAKEISCTNNLKNIALNTNLYIDDSSGFVPGACQEIGTLGITKWGDICSGSYAVTCQLVAYTNPTNPWPMIDMPWHCPLDNDKCWNPGSASGVNYGVVSYCFNRNLIVDGAYGSPGIAKRINHFSMPSGSVVLSDHLSLYTHRGISNSEAGFSDLDINKLAGGNYLFLDGHAKYYYGMSYAKTDYNRSTTCW